MFVHSMYLFFYQLCYMYWILKSGIHMHNKKSHEEISTSMHQKLAMSQCSEGTLSSLNICQLRLPLLGIYNGPQKHTRNP